MAPTPYTTRQHLEDMVASCKGILAYTKGLDLEALISKSHVYAYDGTQRHIQLLGWKAWNLPEAMLSEHSEINWRLLTPWVMALKKLPVLGGPQTTTHYRESARLTHKF